MNLLERCLSPRPEDRPSAREIVGAASGKPVMVAARRFA
jgi:hypothetical protein